MARWISEQRLFVRERGRLRKRRSGSLAQRTSVTVFSPDFMNAMTEAVMAGGGLRQAPAVTVSIGGAASELTVDAGLSTLEQEVDRLAKEEGRESDLAAILAQRAAEAAKLREHVLAMPLESEVRLPKLKEGEELRWVKADRRTPGKSLLARLTRWFSK